MIFLHGASSSGKSTIAKASQQALDTPFWHISIDHLRDAGVLPLTRVRSGEFDRATMREPFFDGYHRSLAAYLDGGNNLIVACSWRSCLPPSISSSWPFIVRWRYSTSAKPRGGIDKSVARPGTSGRFMPVIFTIWNSTAKRTQQRTSPSSLRPGGSGAVCRASSTPSPSSQPATLPAHLSSSATLTYSSGKAVVYLICPIAKDELTSVRLILEISLL